MFEPNVLQLFLRDLFIILSQFLAGSCSVQGVPRPFDQLPSRVRMVNTFKTPGMHLYFVSTFEADVSQLFLFDLFLVLSFLPKLTIK